LPKTITAGDPLSGHAIEEARGFARLKQSKDPSAPVGREALVMKNLSETAPVDTIEGFVEIKLKNQGWGIPIVAIVKEISSVGVVSNATAKNEVGLVSIDQLRNEGLELVGKHFRKALNGGILESNRSKVTSLMSITLLWKEHEVGPIYMTEVSSVSIEIIEELNNGLGGDGPCSLEERGAEAIRARTSVSVHALDNILDLSVIEWGHQGDRG
jgi:hypothetical protein